MPGTRNQNRPQSYERKSYMEKLAFANRRLTREYIDKAASKLSMPKKHIIAVLNGEAQNPKVLNQVYNYTRNRRDTLV